ncbi:MAG: TAXI family TRAP transporter solute-binding subunit [Rhodospirillales bacterium]
MKLLRTVSLAAMLAAIAVFAASAAQAQDRVTLKSATAGTSYYVMTVQLGEALKAASNGKLAPTVEESQGSVQNVKEAPRRSGNFIFTSPPSLVKAAQAGKKPFEGETGYDEIRTLFIMPPITMHFVVRADSGINGIADLNGKTFISGGHGTFTQRQTNALLKLFDLEGKVKIADVELSAANDAVRNKRVDGYASGSSHPVSLIQELASTTPIKLLSLTDEQLNKVLAADPGAGKVTIAPNTYQGQKDAVQTFGLPVGAYTTTKMDNDTAYQIVKIFWTQRSEMAKANPWWGSLTPDQVMALGIKLHPGAAKFYAEQGVKIPDAMK